MGERKLVQTLRKPSTTDLNAKLVTNGEVRQAQTPGRMDLREVNVALGTMQGTPLTHSTLQGTQSTLVSYWPGWRRCSSSNNVTALSNTSVCNSGTTSASQTSDSASSRVRQLRVSRCEGKASVSSMRSLMPARAAAATCVSVLRTYLYLRTWWSVIFLPGIPLAFDLSTKDSR
jgi:hypothetical protein